MSEWLHLFNPVEEAMQRSMSGDEDDLEAMVHNALDAVPDNWAKVEGVWHHLPDEHFVTCSSESGPPSSHIQGRPNWIIEHSLACRVRGMSDCEIQALWEDHLDQGGRWSFGRFKFVNLNGSVTDAEGDTRTFDLEPAPKEQ